MDQDGLYRRRRDRPRPEPPPLDTRATNCRAIRPPARYVSFLEINSGQAEIHSIVPGSRVVFAGQIEGRWGC